MRRRRPRRQSRHWRRIAAALNRLGGLTADNRVEVGYDGDAFFEALWTAIDGAQYSVSVEMYTVVADGVGTRTRDALIAAARRGCRVRLLYDAVGSLGLPESWLAPLREAGAHVHAFNPLLPRLARRSIPLLRRDHRKIITIDGRLAFCGGRNLSDDYAGPSHGAARFHDCHVRVEGPCVHELQRVTASSLRPPGRRRPRRRRESIWSLRSRGGALVQVLASAGRDGRRGIQRATRKLINAATDECLITTPYFVPPRPLQQAILRAARRGVNVQILTAGPCDVPTVHLAAQHVYGRLVREGVTIREYQATMLHAKTLVVDNRFCTVGTFNLDTWSDRRNLEVVLNIIDPAVASHMRARFFADAEQALQITPQDCAQRNRLSRLLCWAAYHLMRL